MLIRLLQGVGLLALTVTVHTLVLGAILARTQRRLDKLRASFIAYSRLLAQIAAVMILAHLVEIAFWALFFVWQQALPDLETSYYFSAVTYATIGYGDVVLPAEWRLLGAIEGLTGILMCGWSAAFFFAVFTRIQAGARPRS